MKALVLSELRQRIRGKRWWILLALWTLILFGLLVLIRGAAINQLSYLEFQPGLQELPIGPAMFGSLALLILGLSSLVLPSLTSTSINGERDRGTLAVLQSTLYRPWQIVGAKFIAAMIMAGAFLAATVPLTLWCMAEGGVAAGRTVVVYVIFFLMAAVLVLIGLAASSLVRRPSLSAIAAYGLVFLLTAGSPIMFGIALASSYEERCDGDICYSVQESIGWRWLILAPDPFVILADAAPRSQGRYAAQYVPDPLQAIRSAVRDSRKPPEAYDPNTGQRIDPFTGEPLRGRDRRRPPAPPALWPAGLSMDLGLAAVAAFLAIARLRLPAKRLAAGERVA